MERVNNALYIEFRFNKSGTINEKFNKKNFWRMVLIAMNPENFFAKTTKTPSFFTSNIFRALYVGSIG